MADFEETDSQGWWRKELKTARRFCLWIVLSGPLIVVSLWAAVEGPSVSWQKARHLYLLILVHFLCYTPLFAAGLMLIPTRRLRTHWWLLGLGGVALAGLSSLCATGISALLGVRPGPEGMKGLVFSTCRGLLVTGLVLAVSRLYHSAVVSRFQAQRREIERERASRAAVEARWNSLESRVHPHFLFNTLSSIRELMHRDLGQADIMIQRFSNLLRFSLDSSCNTLVPLADEWLTLSEYLEIEKMRMGSRLKYKLTLLPECKEVVIPALSVLTLVENSVKHAVACRRSGGLVEVAAHVEGAHLFVQVSDDGEGFDESAIRPGHGLDLLLRRLETLYQGHMAYLELPPKRSPVTVTLKLPVTTRNSVNTLQHEQTSLLPR